MVIGGRRKKVPGRKRGPAVDAFGLIVAVVVTAASSPTTPSASGCSTRSPNMRRPSPTPWVDARFKQDFATHAAVRGIDVEVVKRSDAKPAFVPVKKRWIVEQVNGTLMLHRRLARDESRPESSVSHTLRTSMANMARRLIGTSTPTGGARERAGASRNDPRPAH
jgi:hypothetical protein